MLCGACRDSDSESEIDEPKYWHRGTSSVETQELAVPVRKRAPRTTHDPAVPAPEALEALKAGNKRFAQGVGPLVRQPLGASGREELVEKGQRPSAIVLGCADSRVPSDTIFDAQPGDLFILRNAGNTLVKAEGSVVGSMEYAVAHLQVKLILVLGHSNCGAIAGATKVMLERKASGPAAKSGQSALEALLDGLAPVAEMTAAQLPKGADEKTIATNAIRTNVFHSMSTILLYSKIIREAVKAGDVEIHGGIYDLKSGKVEFLGQHPMQAKQLLDLHLDITKTDAMGA